VIKTTAAYSIALSISLDVTAPDLGFDYEGGAS
jgi:hypothetical protein